MMMTMTMTMTMMVHSTDVYVVNWREEMAITAGDRQTVVMILCIDYCISNFYMTVPIDMQSVWSAGTMDSTPTATVWSVSTHALYSSVLFWMTLDDLEWLIKISNDAKGRAASLRQLSFLWPLDLDNLALEYGTIDAVRIPGVIDGLAARRFILWHSLFRLVDSPSGRYVCSVALSLSRRRWIN